MAKKTIYRSVISFVVLSEQPIPENATLDNIVNQYVIGNKIDKKETQLTGKVGVNEIYKIGSEPQFFFMDDEGNELEEEDTFPYEDVEHIFGE